jgi:hypothetical protein
MNASSGGLSQTKIDLTPAILRLDFESYLWMAQELTIVWFGLQR